jgi:hypothetical protein
MAHGVQLDDVRQELKEALDTLGLGEGEDAGLTSCTFPEFALLCSAVLEDEEPSRFLIQAFQHIFQRAVQAWADAAVAGRAE